MAQFFSTQMDYIYFFYGLAFIVLGVVCLKMYGSSRQRLSYMFLGLLWNRL